MADINKQGVLIVVSGPSGAGKGTVCRSLRTIRPDVKVSISVTTRAPRPGEEEGVHYFFRTVDEFNAMRENGEFLEWAEVYGNFYGTPVKAVQEVLNNGENVLLEIDIQGALRVKEIFPDAAMVFVVPPSMDILRERITGRGTEVGRDLLNRFRAAGHELTYVDRYDYVVVNNEVEQAANEISAILVAEACRVSRNKNIHSDLLEGKEI